MISRTKDQWLDKFAEAMINSHDLKNKPAEKGTQFSSAAEQLRHDLKIGAGRLAPKTLGERVADAESELAAYRAENPRKWYQAAGDQEKALERKRDYLAEQDAAQKRQKMLQADLDEIAAMTPQERGLLETYVMNRDQGFWQNLNPMMDNTFGQEQLLPQALVDKYGEQRVRELAESYDRGRNRDATEAVREVAGDMQGSGWLGNLAANALSVPAGLMGQYAGLPEQIRSLMYRTGRYGTLDENSIGNLGDVFSGTVRSETQKDIEGEDPNILQKAGSWLYQGGMGILDTYARMLTGGGKFARNTLMATGSFSRNLMENSAAGASPWQAAAKAALDTALEVASESEKVDSLFEKIGKAPQNGRGQVWRDILKQAGIEITTEEATLLGSLMTDDLIMRGKSGYRQKVGELLANGESYENAKRQAQAEILEEFGNTAIVSGLSGAGSTAAGAAVNRIRYGAPASPDSSPDRNADGSPILSPEAQAYLDRQRDKQDQPKQEKPKKKNIFQEAAEHVREAEKARTEGTQQSFLDAAGEMIQEMSGNAQRSQGANVPSMDPEMEQAARTVMGISGQDAGKEKGDRLEQSSIRLEEDIGDYPYNRPKETVGAAPANFANEAQYNDLLYDGNTQRDRKGDVRPVEVPATDAEGKRVSEFVGNAWGSRMTPDTFLPTIRQLVNDGKLSHSVMSNEQSLKEAANAISAEGAENTLAKIQEAAAKGKTSPQMVAQAELLYNYYVNDRSAQGQQRAAEIFTTLSELATNTGRAMQMYSLFRKMTPDGMAANMEQEIRRSLDKLEGRGKITGADTSVVDQAVMDAYKEAAYDWQRAKPEDQADAKRVMDQLREFAYWQAATRTKATLQEKWDAWRYMAMLGNVKTQVRNIAGNALMTPFTELKRNVDGLIQSMLIRDKSKRTASFGLDFSENGRALLEWAEADAKSETVRSAMKYTGKLGEDAVSQKMDEYRRVFDTTVFEKYRKLTNDVTQGGDILFKNLEYSRSLASFLNARGYTAEQARSGSIPDAVMMEARSHALDAALKATFNDRNQVSDALSSIGYKNPDTKFKKIVNAALAGTLPFRRTPANVAVRAVEYSPVGLTKGLWDAVTKVADGKMSAAAAIEEISQGLVGSGAMLLGAALWKGFGGIKLTGKTDDEDEKRQGHQSYALEFAIDGQEYSYTIDWASPANLPLFIGANVAQILEEKGADDPLGVVAALVTQMPQMFEPMLEMSFLSSLNDLVESAKYAQDGEALWTIALSMATGYFTQGFPSLLRQGIQAAQQNRRQTFANSDDDDLRPLQRTLARIPGVGELAKTDYIDAFGRRQDNGDWMERAFNSFFNPGTLRKIDGSPVEQEISRLNEATAQGATPPEVSKTISYTDRNGDKQSRRLTEQEYTAMRETQGQTAYKLLEGMIGNQDYAGLTDEQKADAIDLVYDYAREMGRRDAIKDYADSGAGWMAELGENQAQDIVEKVALDSMDSAMRAMFADLKKGYDSSAEAQALSAFWDSFQTMSLGAQENVRSEATGNTEHYIAARDAGVSHRDFVTAATATAGAEKDIDRYSGIAEINAGQKAVDGLMKAWMKDYDPQSESPDYTELKYDAVRKLGYSPKQYADIYRAYLEGSKKAERVEAMRRAAGCSYNEALTLYSIFSNYKKYAGE